MKKNFLEALKAGGQYAVEEYGLLIWILTVWLLLPLAAMVAAEVLVPDVKGENVVMITLLFSGLISILKRVVGRCKETIQCSKEKGIDLKEAWRETSYDNWVSCTDWF